VWVWKDHCNGNEQPRVWFDRDRTGCGPVSVVVVDVIDDEALELSAVPDQGAVEELSTDGADPAFGERVRHGVRMGVVGVGTDLQRPDGVLRALRALTGSSIRLRPTGSSVVGQNPVVYVQGNRCAAHNTAVYG
jgi:hypothetical protein